MIAAMQKLNISRLSIFMILLPGSPNALGQIATIKGGKQDRNDRLLTDQCSAPNTFETMALPAAAKRDSLNCVTVGSLR
jgi:hypothetical protein